jgi:branched-chain amino acid transport system permease protein
VSASSFDLGRWGTAKGRRLGGILLALAVLALFPVVFPNATVTTIAVYCLMYMAMATAWNTFSGFSGYVSLGHAVFFGTGAYTTALMATHLRLAGGYDLFGVAILGGLVAGVAAVPIGIVALRTRRHTFVVITIAVFFIFQLVATNLSFTQGSEGVVLPSGQFSASTYNDPFYGFLALVLLGTVAYAVGLRRSRFGLQLLAIRDDEDRARSLGVKVWRVKLLSYCFSAVLVGVVGGVWAFFVGQIYPQFAFDPTFDVTIALMAFIGGLGTIAGPILGGLVLEGLQRYLILTVSIQNLYLVIYGALFLAVIVLMPDGVVPTLGRFLRRHGAVVGLQRLRGRRAREGLGAAEPTVAAPTGAPLEVGGGRR